jgi:hypothetical protein
MDEYSLAPNEFGAMIDSNGLFKQRYRFLLFGDKSHDIRAAPQAEPSKRDACRDYFVRF